jgi:hypothetical protein
MGDSADRKTKPTNGIATARSSASLSVAALFAVLWDALADLLGTGATAILLRRATLRAAPDSPELAELAVVRDGLDYRYSLPAAWHAATDTPHALRRLVAELLPLLAELTGPVAGRHLAQVRELRDGGLLPPLGERP